MLHSLYVMYMIIMIIFFGAARTYADVVASRSPTPARVERYVQVQPQLQENPQCDRSACAYIIESRHRHGNDPVNSR
jgi:hypothetical protein